MRTLAESFSIYFHGFRAALAPTMPASRAYIDFIGMLWRYILGVSGRLDRLIARWRSGTLPRPRAPRLAPPHPEPPGLDPACPAPEAAGRPAPGYRFPRSQKWLLRRMPGTGIGAFGSQLQYLMDNDAEFAAFLRAAPQARRLLGPICRMFGVVMPVFPVAEPATNPAPDANPPPASPLREASPVPTVAAAPSPPEFFSTA